MKGHLYFFFFFSNDIRKKFQFSQTFANSSSRLMLLVAKFDRFGGDVTETGTPRRPMGTGRAEKKETGWPPWLINSPRKRARANKQYRRLRLAFASRLTGILYRWTNDVCLPTIDRHATPSHRGLLITRLERRASWIIEHYRSGDSVMIGTRLIVFSCRDRRS